MTGRMSSKGDCKRVERLLADTRGGNTPICSMTRLQDGGFPASVGNVSARAQFVEEYCLVNRTYIHSVRIIRKVYPLSCAYHQLWLRFSASRYRRADSTTWALNHCLYSVFPHCVIIWSRKKRVQIPLRVAVVPKSYGPAIIYVAQISA